jgi:uncharacterized membrane protein
LRVERVRFSFFFLSCFDFLLHFFFLLFSYSAYFFSVFLCMLLGYSVSLSLAYARVNSFIPYIACIFIFVFFCVFFSFPLFLFLPFFFPPTFPSSRLVRQRKKEKREKTITMTKQRRKNIYIIDISPYLQCRDGLFC